MHPVHLPQRILALASLYRLRSTRGDVDDAPPILLRAETLVKTGIRSRGPGKALYSLLHEQEPVERAFDCQHQLAFPGAQRRIIEAQPCEPR